jgi:ABC-type phosphate transport system substrate-binding protein
MRTRISIRVIAALTFATLCLTLQAQDVIVVANQDVSVSEVTDTELRDLFTGARTRFHDGSRALPVLLKGGPAHEVFLNHYIGGTSDSFRTLWRKAVFTGQGAAPREFASEAALLEYVAITPGAMGYVSHLRTGEKIKVLPVRSTNVRERLRPNTARP